VTGLIYVVIIGLWAAVLIPIWLKRQDQVSEVRSTARFSSAMRSLGDRADRGDSKSGRQVSHNREFTSPRDRAKVQAAKRRSMVLAALTSITAIALIGTILGFIPAFVAITVGVLLSAFLVITMLTASKRVQTPARSSKRAYREFHEVDEFRERRRDQRSLTRAELQVAELDDFANWDPWEEEASGWDAVPQTLPSYVTSSRATAIPRNIERNGDWSSESMLNLVNKAQQVRDANEAELVRVQVANVSDATTEIPIIRANSPYQARAVNE
jgi:hypothetical protein